jgi:hypothetical protein
MPVVVAPAAVEKQVQMSVASMPWRTHEEMMAHEEKSQRPHAKAHGRPTVEQQLSGRWRPPILSCGSSTAAKLPLSGVKPVKALRLRVIEKFAAKASPEQLRRLQTILQFLQDEMYADLPDGDSEWVSHVDDDDLKLLLTHDIIEATTEDGARHIGRLFFVDEVHKGRRRPIFWPRTINDAIDPPTPALADVVDAALDIAPSGWAACFDLSSSFFQVPNGSSKRHFAFRTPRGKFFRFLRMVMGAKFAPEVMQVLCEILADEALTRAGLAGVVRRTVHIDNIRFFAPHRRFVATAAEAFRKVCDEAGVTLNDEPENAPHQRGDFLGLTFDYAAAAVTLSEKTRAKLQAAVKHLDDKEATWADALSLFGICMFASRVCRFALASLWRIFKFIRRRAHSFSTGAMEIGSAAKFWPHIIPEWREWVTKLLASSPARHGAATIDRASQFNFLVTDASLDGWGAALVTATGRLHVAQGKWTRSLVGREPSTLQPDDINTLEMRAVGLGAHSFADLLARNPLWVVVDNTSTMYVLKKGQAKEAEFNAATRFTMETLRSLAAEVFVSWIDTSRNPADGLSRGLRPCTEAEHTRLEDDMSAAMRALVGRRDSPLRVFVPANG